MVGMVNSRLSLAVSSWSSSVTVELDVLLKFTLAAPVGRPRSCLCAWPGSMLHGRKRASDNR